MNAGAARDHGHAHAVLEIENAVVPGTDLAHADTMRGSLRADAGDLVLVQVADLHQAEVWADLSVGLITPERGRVRFHGNDLKDLDMESADWLRGRIGRVFSRGNWLDRLSLVDNILLQARHHSGRDDRALKREASALAESFGMLGIPLGLPDGIRRLDLQRAACVRAFLGEPLLIILEDPTYAAHGELLSLLMGAIRAARNRGAAVVWYLPSTDVWRDRTIPASRRYRIAGNELMEVTGR